MFTIKDFVAKYEEYTDEELIDIYRKIADYSEEAQEALKIVIQNKGGQEALVKRLEEKQILANEVGRIAKETAEFGSKGIDASFIKKMASSDILSPEAVDQIIDNQYSVVQLELEDKKIKPRTVFGSTIISVVLALLIGQLLYEIVGYRK
jgi:hypothetical protein